MEDKKAKLDSDDMPTKEEFENLKNELSQSYKNAIDGLQKDKNFCEYVHHSVTEIMRKINDRTIDATIKDIQNLKMKANEDYNKDFIQYDYKENDLNILMKNLNQTIEAIKAKRINKKNFKKYSMTNLKFISEEAKKVINTKNTKLTEIIQKAISLKKKEYPNN